MAVIAIENHDMPGRRRRTVKLAGERYTDYDGGLPWQRSST